LETRPLDLSQAGIADIHGLLSLVWPEATHIDEHYLTWLYTKNPLGNAYGFNAYENGRLIGHYAAIPVESVVCGRQERGLLSLNTAVHPEARGKGLFKILASACYDQARSQGYEFVMGVSNQNSTLLFQRQLRFQLVSPLSVKIGFGLTQETPTTKPDYMFHRVWDESSLAWRLQRPGNPYRSAKLRNGDQAIYAPTGRCGIWAIMAELACVPQLGAHFYWNPLQIWIGLDAHRSWKRCIAFDLPEKLRPSPLNFIFKDLTDQKRLLDPQSVKISLLDFDAY
jgi:GNAT superfamily N-acetyltransferase